MVNTVFVPVFCAPGYEKYNTIRADPALCFLDRVGRPDEKAIAAEQRANDYMDGWVETSTARQLGREAETNAARQSPSRTSTLFLYVSVIYTHMHCVNGVSVIICMVKD